MEESFSFSVTPLVSDHAVLQRDETIMVCGRGRAGASVAAELAMEGEEPGHTVLQTPENCGSSIRQVSYSSEVRPDGTWQMELPPLPVGGPWCFRAESEGEMLEFHDIYLGDVWIMAGQSNMQLPMERVKYRYPQEYKRGTRLQIRQFTVPIQWSFGSEAAELTGGEWLTAAAEHTPVFSAVAFFFAQKLYERYQVPVGLILAAAGGTPVQAWMSREALRDFPDELKELEACRDSGYVERIQKEDEARIAAWWTLLDERDQGMLEDWASGDERHCWKNISLADRWEEPEELKKPGTVWLRRSVEVPLDLADKPVRISLGTIIDADFLYVNGIKVGSISYRYPPREYELQGLKPGVNLLVLRVAAVHGQGGFTRGKGHRLIWDNGVESDITDGWEYRRGAVMEPLRERTFFERMPAGMYQGMIAPLHRFPVKGICWYQGEMNADEYELYPGCFRRMTEDWRKRWNRPCLPVLFVQLPCYDLEDGKNWVQFREMQRKLTSVPCTAMVVSMDCGEENDLHPVCKKPVGDRLAMAAFQMAYGEEGTWLSPLFSFYDMAPEGMTLHFCHTDGSLGTMGGNILQGFEYCFFEEKVKANSKPAKRIPAEARIEGNTVTVRWPCSNGMVQKESAAVKALNEEGQQSVRKQEGRLPDAIVYSWSNNPVGANLCNSAGLPASPFLCLIEKKDLGVYKYKKR